jgi:hypothetical protein
VQGGAAARLPGLRPRSKVFKMPCVRGPLQPQPGGAAEVPRLRQAMVADSEVNLADGDLNPPLLVSARLRLSVYNNPSYQNSIG